MFFFSVFVMFPCDVKFGLSAHPPPQVRLNASPVRREQKAVPFRKERGGGGGIVAQRTIETG